MNSEQKAYLKSVLHTDDPRFKAFADSAALQAMVLAFERQLTEAWATFIAGTPPPRPELPALPAPYERMAWPDFGAPPDMTGPPAAQPTEPPASVASAMKPPSPPERSTAPHHQSNDTVPSRAPTPPAPSSPQWPPQALRFMVRNARQGELYEGTIVSEPNVPGLRLLDILLPEDAGLTLDLENLRISGTPAIAGEFQLPLRYALAHAPDTVSYTANLPFVINADPKTLWKNIPSDPASPFWKEDSTAALHSGKQASIIAARRRGRSHAHKGTCCDDDFAIVCDDAHGWHLAVLADGAGSARFSRHGSHIVTHAVSSFMQEIFADQRGAALADAIEALAGTQAPDTPDSELTLTQQKVRNELFTTLGYAAHHAMRALTEATRAHADVIASLKELSTTLLIGLARKVGTQWFCAAYWVGDGAIAVYRRNQSVLLLGTPDSGEFSGQTHFLDASQVTQEALLRRLRFELVDDMTAFLLMTDGVSDPKFRSEAAMSQVEEWDRLWDELSPVLGRSNDHRQSHAHLLEWLDFWAPGEYDDRTMAIIY